MIDGEQLRSIADEHMGEGGLFVYDLDAIAETAGELQAVGMPYGLTVRYAAKANPHPDVVACMDRQGLSFDASSMDEAQALIYSSGVTPGKISLSSQILRDSANLKSMLLRGVLPVATSIRQIGMLGEIRREFENHGETLGAIAVRMNPGEGSGGNNRTTVGGPASSFGIWKDQLPEALEAADQAGLAVNRIHTHIGSGVDPGAWRRTIVNSLGILKRFPDAVTLDIGGGYKVARMEGGPATDMGEVFGVFAEELESFADRSGREIHLEIEPGTLAVANAGVLLGRVEETVSTSMYDFLKLNVGMNGLIRPSHYGAQHPIEVLSGSREETEYVIVGPCCESGDLLTPAPDDPEEIMPRRLKKAEVGDYVAIGGAGAYGLTMAAVNYNNVPPPTEIAVSQLHEQAA